jgi:hypothetical protein
VGEIEGESVGLDELDNVTEELAVLDALALGEALEVVLVLSDRVKEALMLGEMVKVLEVDIDVETDIDIEAEIEEETVSDGETVPV